MPNQDPRYLPFLDIILWLDSHLISLSSHLPTITRRHPLFLPYHLLSFISSLSSPYSSPVSSSSLPLPFYPSVPFLQAQKVLQKSEQQGRNEFVIDYDEMNPFRHVPYLLHRTLQHVLLYSWLSVHSTNTVPLHHTCMCSTVFHDGK
jgi:hypothetical protein